MKRIRTAFLCLFLLSSFLKASAKSPELLVLDLRAALGDKDDRGSRWAYDAAKAVGALQGIVNGNEPRLFVTYLDNPLARERGVHPEEACLDRYWLARLREPGRWLAQHEVKETTDVWQIFERFVGETNGLVLWDESVPSTANVASTLAGAEGLIPIRGQGEDTSFLGQFRSRFPRLPVKRDLCGMFSGKGEIPETGLPSSGSAKCDAYLWAVEKLMKTGSCGSSHLAYYVDGVPWNSIAPKSSPYPDLGNAGVLNADYWISRKAFFFDLSPWEDCPATDDPSQLPGTDFRTLRSILQAANERNHHDNIITCGGFVPWWLKYCRSDWGGRDPDAADHDPVPTEWQFVDVLSSYNTILDADAFGLTGLANASVYRHHPLREKYERPTSRADTPVYDPNTTYVLFAMLDYDSSAWLAQSFPVIWCDPRRGEIPLWWGFNPILSQRVPMVFDAIFESVSPKDTIGADEGLGYINPNLLEGDRKFSNLPSGKDLYLQTAKPLFHRFSLTTTAFVITGHQGKATQSALEILAALSPDGVGFQGGGRVEDGEHFGVGFKSEEEDWHPGMSPKDVSERIEFWIRKKGGGSFLFFRCILMRPSQIVEGVEILRTRAPELAFEVLDPAGFFILLKEHAR